jgi:hypothetical protein
MFDENLRLSKTAKYLYGTYLVLVFILSFYWTGSQTGPALPLIKLQAMVFGGRYFGVLTVFILALPLGVAGRLLAQLLDRSGRRPTE